MEHPGPQINRWHAARIALTGGLCAAMLISACGQRRAARPGDNTPTNAGLTNLAGDDSVPTLNVPEDSFEATRQRVAESAALLEEALAQSAYDDTPALNTEVWEAVPTGRSGESTPNAVAEAEVAEAEPEEQTRFSLANAGPNPGTKTPAHAGTNAGFGPSGADPAQQTTRPVEVVQTELVRVDPAVDTGELETTIDPEVRKQQLVDELVGVLTDLARSGSAPGSAALALAGMETLSPDAIGVLIEEGLLSESEAASLDAARRLFDGLRADGGIADPVRVANVLERIQEDLASQFGLRIIKAELCTRVVGYGRYERFQANRFIAGQPQPVIVYAEVDGFAHTESVGDDGTARFEVELSQRLELYHTADDLNTWNRSAETDRTVSRNRVRDYYLINQVTLPGNLSIGRYHLKVVMKDRIGGDMSEAIIPIEIVGGTRAGVDF